MHTLKRLTLLVLLCMGYPVVAQPPASPAQAYDSLSLEDLMNIKITVASIKELTPRQSPGIITYITAEDIRNLGARDLMEVLRHVPGFEFGTDVEGIIGLGVRGNWAHEGKVVLFIDGEEMNERLYSTTQFGNHYPVENIERIEIIRGPGSALHGGFAAYAVINIITRTPKKGTEVSATALQGTTEEAPARTAFNTYIGKAWDHASFSVKLNLSEAQRSHSEYKDVYGSTYNMSSQSGLQNVFVNAGGNIGKLSIRMIADHYTVQSRDEYVEIAEAAGKLEFTNHIFESHYTFQLNEKLKIIPSFRLSNEVSWSSPKRYIETDPEPFRINTTVYNGTINATYDYSENLNLSAGVSSQTEDAKKYIAGEVFNTTGTSNFLNENYAAYAQILYKTKWVNLVSGARYNYNHRYNDALVPRIGVTKEFNNMHLKALFSRAFRAPSILNIDYSENIQPEFTDVYELEGGFKITSDAYITVNAYKILTTDPIVYYVDTLSGNDAYTNVSTTGSTGMDVVFQLKKKWGTFEFNTSYYHPDDGKDFSLYTVPGNDDMHLGLARCKTNALFRINLSQQLLLGTNINWLGTRYAVTAVDETTGEPVYQKLDDFMLLNMYLEYRLKNVKGLSFRFSARNILDQQEWFIQPYNSNHAPLPGMGREFQLRISYQNF
ncbi:MAG: TonB-dependent receptor plug domain-containing protein [Bacteroidia bacterium]